MIIQNFNNNLEQILKNYKSKEVNSNGNYFKLTKMNKDKFTQNTPKEKLICLLVSITLRQPREMTILKAKSLNLSSVWAHLDFSPTQDRVQCWKFLFSRLNSVLY